MRNTWATKPAVLMSMALQGGEGCIEWPYSISTTGYGQLYDRQTNQPIQCHRYLMRELHVPIGGMEIRHHCDNRACINIEHLTVGTRQQNAMDMVRRGRHGTKRYQL